jgi:hypothetical protein
VRLPNTKAPLGKSAALPVDRGDLFHPMGCHQVSVDGGAPFSATLARDYSLALQLSMPPETIHTVVVNAPASAHH